MAERDESEEELREMLRKFLSGEAGFDPSQLAGAAGMPSDPAALQSIMFQLQHALQNSTGEVDWSITTQQANRAISANPGSVTHEQREQVKSASHVAALWISEATEIGSAGDELILLSRQQWAERTAPVWIEMAQPVAESIAGALATAMRENAPEEAQGMLSGAENVLRGFGGTLFAMQLGQVIGGLAGEVVSAGDIGIPLLDDGAVLPVNLLPIAEGLEIPADQVNLWFSVRELAHARLFRHARWLRLDMITSIREYAAGLHIDMERIESLAVDFDPQNPEQLRQALTDGSLIPEKTEEQREALAKLETTLALVEGWVDCVTERASVRLPKRDAISEAVRRRRASGGPAEKALGSLVGLELRPRRLREAAAFWNTVTEAVGPELRDSLWAHPDLLPTSDDIDDASSVIAKLRGETPEQDDMDRALDALLAGDFDDLGGSPEVSSHTSAASDDSVAEESSEEESAGEVPTTEEPDGAATDEDDSNPGAR
ncbi:zinc-dependent metalloprotease [Humidisolicoccus flavus]|uniref:zinc-dependent metalloprotease n=1 Tax=Humidisolicoccus flavus TaxID=3111414 RepID=UPI003254CB8E